VTEQNFSSKKKFHDFDDEFLIPNNNTSIIRGTGIQYPSNNLGQSIPRKEKLISNEVPLKNNYPINVEEKENSPTKIDNYNGSIGKNRMKSSLKFIEESFDISKKNEAQISSNNFDISTSTTGNQIQRDRINNASKKDIAKKFVEENMIFNEKSTLENSPPRYMYNQNTNNNPITKKIEIIEDTGEYEFESRRKKR